MAIQYLHDLNINYNELQNAKLHVTTSTPTAVKGVIYYDDNNNVIKYRDNAGWKTIETTTGDSNTFLSGLAFNTSSGVLTATLTDSSTVTVDLDGKYAEASHVHTFASLTSKPTTIDGFGITDAFDGAYSSLSGIPSTFTPASHTHAASDVTSGTFADARIPSLAASKITSGTFGTARIPDLAASKITSGTLGTARIPNLAASKINSGTFDAARIPNLAASKISSGQVAVAQGGTGASTLDGAGIVLKSGAQSIAGNKTFSNNVTVNGDLIVSGNQTTKNSEVVLIEDNIITLNSNETGSPSEDSGILVERGTATNVQWIWDESASRWGAFGGESMGTKGNVGVGTLYADTLDVTNYGLTAGDIPNLNTSKLTAGTLPVARGGTGATSFTDKSVIVSQDTGTDALAAKAMTTNGSLLIGGTSGPEVATLTAGSNVTITNANNSITIASSVSTSDINNQIDARSSAHTITGDGSDVEFTITYGFTAAAINDVMIQVVDSSGDHDGDTVFAEVERHSTTQCKIKFATAPANNKTYRVLCFKIA
tara:strand:- start:3245 stop:4867 length:1623 start_codon:yes stop_codon:yes gene_type:complete